VYVRASDLSAIRQNFDLPGFSQAASRIQSDQSPLCNAFRYLLDGNAAHARAAVDSALVNLRACTDARTPFNPMQVAACVYDWCYDRLTLAEKNEFIAEFQRVAGLHSPYYPARSANAVVGHDTEAWLLSDQLPAGVAIYDESKTMYDSAAALFFDKFVEVRDFFFPAHMHHQGDSYIATRFQHDQLASWLFRRMGAGNVLSIEQQYVPYQIVYHLRPDGCQIKSGDTYDDIGKSSAKRRIALHTGCYYGDPWLMTMADAPYFWSFSAMDRVLEFLFRAAGAEKRPLNELPPTKYFPAPMGEMVARTGWTMGIDSRDAVVHMRIGEYFFGNHQRKDFGTFQVYFRGALAVASGVYEGVNSGYGTDHWTNYYHQTVAHNGLLIYDPAETMPRGAANDGGQTWPNGGRDHPSDLAMLTDTANGYKMGDVTARAFGPDTTAPVYSYIAGDITAAYGSNKVSAVTRSMVTLNTGNVAVPCALVVYDRVAATNAQFKKTWLVHTIQEPVVQARKISVKRDSSAYSGSGQYGGKLEVQSLLPTGAVMTKVGGAGREFWIESVQTNYATSKGNGAEPCAWRVEVSPASAALDDAFLHVLTVMDDTAAAGPAAQLLDTAGISGATLLNHAVIFSKTGQPLTQAAFRLTGTGTHRVLVTDLEPGLWTVRKDGSPLATLSASQDAKCLYFESAPGLITLDMDTTGITLNRRDPVPVRSLSASPNPFNALAFIRISLPRGTHARDIDLKIFNMRGRLVKNLSEQARRTLKGTFASAEWRTHGLPAGVYVLKLRAGGQQVSRRLTLLR
jgi:hypothetical protein